MLTTLSILIHRAADFGAQQIAHLSPGLTKAQTCNVLAESLIFPPTQAISMYIHVPPA